MEKHFTATVYIISKIDGEIKILLHRHKKLNMWLGIGGHLEKDEDPVEAAIREVKEETGLDIEFISQDNLFLKKRTRSFESKGVKQLISPFAIMEEKISLDKDKGPHYHIDFIYFAITKTPKEVKMEEESGWFSKEELKKLDLEEDMKFLSKKALGAINIK